MTWGESQSSGKGIPEEGTASAKALRLALLATLEEEAEGPPGWNVVIEGVSGRK